MSLPEYPSNAPPALKKRLDLGIEAMVAGTDGFPPRHLDPVSRMRLSAVESISNTLLVLGIMQISIMGVMAEAADSAKAALETISPDPPPC